MPLEERFRSGGTRGIARFLADHQHCDAGFDVRREEETGSGRLRITCLGCGQTITYKAAEAGELAAAGIGFPLGDNGEAQRTVEAPDPPRPPVPTPQRAAQPRAPRTTYGGRGDVRPRPQQGRLSRWLPIVLISALILGGLAMIAAGLLRSDEDSEPTTPTAPQTEAQDQPESEGRNQPQTGGQDQPAAKPDSGGQQGASSAGSVQLDRRTFDGRFAIGVPAGWDSRAAEAVEIKAPGGTAEVRVFFDQGERSRSELASGATEFLAAEHPDARVGDPKSTRLAGRRAVRITATYGGGEETAVALSAKGFSFVIAERVDRGASARIKTEADAAVASFEPK